MSSRADISETSLAERDPLTLSLLLCDKTTGGNIRWVTDDYSGLGTGYAPDDEIVPAALTGEHEGTVCPRFSKSEERRVKRTRENAEVFTPAWVCCRQNNEVDDAWFGRRDAIVVSSADGRQWDPNPDPIRFDAEHTWQRYVDKRVLEFSCGEAPYIVSRYDVTSGILIPPWMRVGLLDRKLRVVLENTLCDDEAFEKWVIRAYEASYAFDLQGDNVILARENLLATLDDYCVLRDGAPAAESLRHKVANRIAWNVFQMDGLTYEVPFATRPANQAKIDFFGEGSPTEPVPARIRDWRACTGGATIDFRDLLREKRR